MDLLPSEEQNRIVDACVQFLVNELPVDRLHQVDGDKHPLMTRSTLMRMAELGWFGLGLSEAQGGVGYSLKEEALLFVELGRHLVSPAVLGSVLGARVATLAGNTELAAKIIAGELWVAPAIETDNQAVVGEKTTGTFYAVEAQQAELILLVQATGLALIENNNDVSMDVVTCMDEKIHMASVCIDANAVAYVASSTENLYLRGVLLTAAMQLGIAQATRDRSVEYAKVREQYGKPIGAFQAIKHTCAEMAVRCESVMSMLYYASIVLDDPDGSYGENFQFDTVAVKILATNAAQNNANEAVQVHGGMGFTQEMDIHLFVKRAQVLDQLFGSKREQSEALISFAGPVL